MKKIIAADGHEVSHVQVKNKSDSLVILSHGITTNKDEDGVYTDFAEKILAPKFDSVRFDFRGHGESAIPPTEVTIAGEILDFMAVVKWAGNQGYSRMFHVGTSFGASITLLSVSVFRFDQFERIAFWSPVISYVNTFIEAKVEWGREFFNQKDPMELAYRNGTHIPETEFVIGPRMTMELLVLKPENTMWPKALPLLIIHGDSDTLVPHSDAVEYCKRFKSTAELVTLQGVDHGFDEKLSEAFEKTFKWFSQNG